MEDSPADIKAKNIQIDIQKAMDSAAEHPQKRWKLMIQTVEKYP
jgi:hypothetical protein